MTLKHRIKTTIQTLGRRSKEKARSRRSTLGQFHLEALDNRTLLSIATPIANYANDGYGQGVYVGQSAYGDGLYHAGEDATATAGTPERAIADGVVRYSGADPNQALPNGYGNVVVIEHARADGSRFVSITGHLSPNGLRPVGPIRAGETIGFVGSDAQNGEGGPHVHLRVNEGPYVDTSYTQIGGWLNPVRHSAGWNAMLRPSNAIGQWNFGTAYSYSGAYFDQHGWSIGHGLGQLSNTGSAWRLDPNPGLSDPYVLSEAGLRLAVRDVDAVKVSVRSNIPGAAQNRDMQLYYRLRYANGSVDPGFSEQRSVRVTGIPQGQFQEVSFDLRTALAALPNDAEVYQLRLDPGTVGDFGSGDSVDIDWIATYLAGDNFSNRLPLSGSSAAAARPNSGASKETGEPNHAGNAGGRSLWWSWTAPASSNVTIDTIGSNFDTTLGVYTGTTISGLSSVASDDDGGGALTSRVAFYATAGVTYQIAVDGYSGASGTVVLHVNQQPSGPANDAFANVITLVGSAVAASGTNVGATREAGEPNQAGNSGGHSVWWSWTAPSSGYVAIDTIGSNFDTLLGVYTGSSVSTLSLVASDDDGGGNLTSRVRFFATAGRTYRIAVDGYGGATGNVRLRIAY